jgi:RNA polymerase sigma-70 factor (ECF subfamily)
MSQFESKQQTQRFLTLLGKHEPQLAAYVFSLVSNFADAEDLVQELRLRLWDQFDAYDPNKDFGAWGRTIARYLVLAHWEKQGRTWRNLTSAEFLDAVGRSYEAQGEVLQQRSQALRTCIDKLPAKSRELLMKVYQGRETLQQVAATLGRSYEAIRKNVQRVRQIVRTCITRQLQKVDG